MILALLALLVAAPPAAAPPKPRLVVMITVDQLRPDYLERWRSELTGGLGRLLAQGAVFTDAYQDHAITETAPGHATILSGRWPAHTGIASNAAGVFDSAAALIGVAGPGASPHRFRGTALFDWLQAADTRARALSVSRKDRGAILPVGRARQHVYWYQSGFFTTSAYYRDSLPRWVRAFNGRRVPFKAAGTAWTTLRPDSLYPEPDDQPWENGGQATTFPHVLPADSARAALVFAGIPSMDSLTLAFALAGAEALELGRRGATDLLAISLSATDAVGHAFGPHSREVHDMVLRLDRYVGWFLDRLLRRYRAQDVVIALTADHGVTPFPAEARAYGHPEAKNVEVGELFAAVNAPLRVGNETTIAALLPLVTFDGGMVLVDRAELGRRGMDVDSLVGAVATRLRAVPGVARVDRPADLAAADTARDAVARRWVHQLPPDDLPALVVTLEPYAVWGNLPYAMHGQPSDVDAAVPVVLWGRAVKPGTYGARVNTVDIAPTLARLAGVRPLEPLDGRPLVEALRDRP